MKTISISSVTVGFAKQTLTAAAAPSDGDTFTIGNKTYTAKTVLGTTEGQVLIGGSAAAFLTNLAAAIDHTGATYPNNTKYYCAAAHTQVEVFAVTATTLIVSALSSGTAANSYATTETGSHNLTWGNTTLLGGVNLVINGTATEAPTVTPAQQITVAEYPANNRAFIRTQRMTNTQLQCLKGYVGVALTLAEWSKIAMAIENGLTYAPKILTQPTAQSCVHASTAAVFTVLVSSELATAETYQWQYSADGTTGWTNASGTVNDCAYTNGTTASLTCTPTTTGQTGYYHRCQITNGVGTTTTDAVVLTIT